MFTITYKESKSKTLPGIEHTICTNGNDQKTMDAVIKIQTVYKAFRLKKAHKRYPRWPIQVNFNSVCNEKSLFIIYTQCICFSEERG